MCIRDRYYNRARFVGQAVKTPPSHEMCIRDSYLAADSTEGLKNIKRIMKAFSDTANVDIDGMIKKSENREKKMQKLLGKALFEVLFLQIVIYLTGRNTGKDFFRTEGTVFFMITMLVILNALKII